MPKCEKCLKEFKRGLYLHQKHCKGFHHEVVKVISDALKSRDTGDKEADFIYLLENNELDDLRRSGIEIPQWRRETSTYPLMNKTSFKGIKIKFVEQFEK